VGGPGGGGGISLIGTWKRRFISIPLVFLCFAILVLFSPVLFIVALIHGTIVSSRFSALRLLVFGFVFLFWEVAGLLVAWTLWLGLGWRKGQRARFVAANHRLQWAWGASLLKAARMIFAVEVIVEDAYSFSGKPILLLVRHNSFADSLIAVSYVSWRHGYGLRYVLKEELLWDPCLDVVGLRLPNAFIARRGLGAGTAVQQVGELAGALEAREGVVIYPEGTRFTPEKQGRMVAQLAERWPALHEKARAFRYVLPPKAGGFLELLEAAAPECDVVICAHSGLERVMAPLDVLRGGLAGQEVRIRFWGTPLGELPPDGDGRMAWLYGQWAEVDRFVSGERSALN